MYNVIVYFTGNSVENKRIRQVTEIDVWPEYISLKNGDIVLAVFSMRNIVGIVREVLE